MSFNNNLKYKIGDEEQQTNNQLDHNLDVFTYIGRRHLEKRTTKVSVLSSRNVQLYVNGAYISEPQAGVGTRKWPSFDGYLENSAISVNQSINL